MVANPPLISPIEYLLPVPNPDHEPGPCNLADPGQVLLDFVTAPLIMGAFISAANDCPSGDGPLPPWELQLGSVAVGGADLRAGYQPVGDEQIGRGYHLAQARIWPGT